MRSKHFTKKPPSESAESQQNRVLDSLKRDKALVSIALTTGIAVVGRIAGYDHFVVILEPPNGAGELLVYKSQIVTISRKQTAAAGAGA